MHWYQLASSNERDILKFEEKTQKTDIAQNIDSLYL